MICPVCKEQGKESFVYPGMGSTTLMYCQPYYDKKGVYHDHDSNTRSYSYSCSNRHSWGTISTGQCPNCDFGKDSEKIIIYDNSQMVSGSISYNNVSQTA